MTWQVKPLGEICEFQRGLTYAKGDEVAESDNVVLRANNIDLATNHLDLSDLRHIRQEIAIPNAKRVRKGSLIICTASGSKSHLGKVALIDDDYGYAFGGFMGQITPKPGLSSKYLFHLMTSDLYKDFISGLSDGANINNLKFDDLGRFGVPFSSEEEQHRIVVLLDEAFACIATAKANVEKSMRNAREVFSGYLDAMLDMNKDLKERRLGDLVTRLTNGYVGPIKNVYVETGVPYLLARHVRDNKLKFDGKTFITNEFNQKNRKSILKIGDVLLVQSGHIGHSAVVPEEHEGHNCHAMIVITPVEGAMTGKFLSLLFNTAKMRKEFDAIRSGSTVPHLTCKEVREMAIKLPDLGIQKKMVAQSRELQAQTRHLESLYTRKLAGLAELKQSLLQRAFSGQL